MAATSTRSGMASGPERLVHPLSHRATEDKAGPGPLNFILTPEGLMGGKGEESVGKAHEGGEGLEKLLQPWLQSAYLGGGRGVFLGFLEGGLGESPLPGLVPRGFTLERTASTWERALWSKGWPR